MNATSNFIQSLQFLLKRHLNSNEKLRTVAIIFDTELKKESDQRSTGEIPVVFSKVLPQAAGVKSPETLDHPSKGTTQEPHPANPETGVSLKTPYLIGTDTPKPVNNLSWEFEPQFEAILSIREKEIIQTLAKGYNHKMIAGKLGISINTVRNHFRRIHSKLGVHSNMQVLLRVFKTGITKTRVLLFLYGTTATSICM